MNHTQFASNIPFIENFTGTIVHDMIFTSGSKALMDFSLEFHLVNQDSGMQVLLFREIPDYLLS